MLSKEEIKAKAEEIFKEHGLTIPFSVSSLATALNIEIELSTDVQIYNIVKEREANKLKDNEKEQILGYYNRNENRFYINDTDQSMTRQRFTIAHEIGHHVLHLNYPDNNLRKVILKRDLLTFIPADNLDVKFIPIVEENIEKEANEFAAYLLAPDIEIKKRLPLIELWLGGETFIRGIANLFGVSLEMMRIRLKTFKSENPDEWIKFDLKSKLF